MRFVQFELSGSDRRVGVVDGEKVIDLTSVRPEWKWFIQLVEESLDLDIGLAELTARALAGSMADSWPLAELLAAPVGGEKPFLRPPLDHPDPARVIITGTGLTHTGSMKSRDQMHTSPEAKAQSLAAAVPSPLDGAEGVLIAPASPEPPKTDSAKMFEMGLAGGKPAAGQRGVAPEWFYKGTGTILRGPGEPLDVPSFALDGGEEPELVGCYVIDRHGEPRRIGFALGNEWSDHATEKINYLYLAPSKLRTCSVGPEISTDFDFQSLELSCTVQRGGVTIYSSGPMMTGEQHMCHSLANLEDHHFKYPQHRRPGDIHLHFFGTTKLSYSTREWVYQEGDEIVIQAESHFSPLRNRVSRASSEPISSQTPVRVWPL